MPLPHRAIGGIRSAGSGAEYGVVSGARPQDSDRRRQPRQPAGAAHPARALGIRGRRGAGRCAGDPAAPPAPSRDRAHRHRPARHQRVRCGQAHPVRARRAAVPRCPHRLRANRRPPEGARSRVRRAPREAGRSRRARAPARDRSRPRPRRPVGYVSLVLTEARVSRILTRTTGFLRTVSSHSLQPYRGCTFGRTLCGVGCYVRHNRWVTRGAPWGDFLEVRTNAADAYREQYDAERAWARRSRDGFTIFLSSSTEPFLPQEDRFGVTRRVLEAMCERAPDGLIIQTHTDRVTRYLDLYPPLAAATSLRFHISIESDRDRLPGLPPPASSVARRLEAAAALRAAGLRVVITVSPLLPIADPRRFFERLAEVADAVVVDHFIEGDDTPGRARTLATPLPEAMARVEPASVRLDYRDRMVAVAEEVMPGRVGVSVDGFAGRFRP